MTTNLASIMSAGARVKATRTDAWWTVDVDGVTVERYDSKDGRRRVARASLIRAITTPTAAAEGVVIGMLAAAGIDPSPDVIADAASSLATVGALKLGETYKGIRARMLDENGKPITAVAPTAVYVRAVETTDDDGEVSVRVTFDHGRASHAVRIEALAGESLTGALASIVTAAL